MRRFATLENHGSCAQVFHEDPLDKGNPYKIPPGFFHLQKYLENIKWPVNKYAPMDIKVTLFERRVCNRIDRVPEVDDAFPKWSRLDATNMLPAVQIPTNTVFTVDVSKIRQTMELYRKMKFSLGTDSVQPFEGMSLRILQQVPPILAKKLSMVDFFATLRTERAFMGQVFSQESVRTPEAYKEILRLIDIEGLVKRLMLKSTLILLAQLEAADPQDTKPDELMSDWRHTFKEKLVMLFVNSFVFSADSQFLDGSIFQESLRIKSEQEWTRFADKVRDSLQLRNNRSPDEWLPQIRSLIGAVKIKKPNWASGLSKVETILEYQFQSPKPVNQCLEQLAQVVSTIINYEYFRNHKCYQQKLL